MSSDRAGHGAGAAGAAAGLLLALAPACMLVVLLLRPVWDVDVFWQLKLGELILQNAGPLAREPFAATHLGEPIPSFAWLGQALMALVRRFGGWTGLRLFDALCWLGGFLVVAAACRGRGLSVAGVLLGLVIAFVAALPMASVRPQSFAVLCFGGLLALLRLELRPGLTTVLAVPLLLLWQNLHPSVSVGALALIGHAAAGWWSRFAGRAAAPWEPTLLAAVAGAAMLATPDGVGILRISADNARASAAMGVSEWLPLWDEANRLTAVPVLLVAVVTSWILLRNARRIDSGEVIVAVTLFAMTAIAYRFVLFWAVALIPPVARALAPPRVERRIPAALAPLALLAAVLGTPLLAPTRFAETIPLAAIDRLRATGVQGTIFAHFPWGGPVIDRGFPTWRVAYDGRYYRYSPQEWTRYRQIASGALSLAEVDRLYHPVGYVLEPRWDGTLISALRKDAGEWREVAADGAAVVFVRRSVEPIVR